MRMQIWFYITASALLLKLMLIAMPNIGFESLTCKSYPETVDKSVHLYHWNI